MDTVEDTPAYEPKPRRKVWIVAGVALVVMLGAAAFLAGKLMAGPEGARQGFGSGKGPILSMRGPGGAEKVTQLNLEPATELPQTQPEVHGVLKERKDNSLFIGTGNVSVQVSAKPGGSPSSKVSNDGPTVEVVITQDTKIYQDVTHIEPDQAEGVIQQKVELASLEAVGSQSVLAVWGRKVGDRVIADVIMFSQPYMIKAAPAGGN